MVKEALRERASMLQSAPHLTHPLPIMLPVYTYVKKALKSRKIQYFLFKNKTINLLFFQMVASAILLGRN